jgi:hypothetical protein
LSILICGVEMRSPDVSFDAIMRNANHRVSATCSLLAGLDDTNSNF